MRVLAICILLLTSCCVARAASEEFPAKFRGLWATSKEACNALTAEDAAYVRFEEKWLKVTATNVMGSAQGRFLREAAPSSANGIPPEPVFEMQSLEDSGRVVRLALTADGRLRVTNGEVDEATNFLFCSSGYSGAEQFPERLRGIWADKQPTCDLLKTKGPVNLREDQHWLKIAAMDVLGSSQGRLLRERRPAQMVNTAPAAISFEIQWLDTRTSNLADLTLSLDGRLYETMVGARASASYLRCESVLPRGKAN